MKKEVLIYAEDKAAAITLITGISPLIKENEQGFYAYAYPNNPEIKAALQSFFDNCSVPCKGYSSLCKSLRQQLLSIKNQKQVQKGVRRKDD